MINPKNGNYSEELGYYNYWTTIYYDDLTHQGFVHDAYFLRLFEHAREFMIDSQYLNRLHAEKKCGFVAVKTEQTHSKNLKSKTFNAVGNFLNIRTKVEIDGIYRIKFLHEAYASKNLEDKEAVLICKGYVDMIVFDFDQNKISKLPESIFDQVFFTKKTNGVLKKQKFEEKQLQVNKYIWKVQDYDTDFTKVVYQAKYLQYYEASRRKLLEDVNLTLYKAEINFKEPVKPDEEIHIHCNSIWFNGKFKLCLKQEMKNKSGRTVNFCISELVSFNEQFRLQPLQNINLQNLLV
eukprot:snap_masked-scaffold_2-processed-gene-2.6-mRNA-1 protein AED:1.00 eAED:1.00 QI:0/-1/0/0/-1/1/1/0/292